MSSVYLQNKQTLLFRCNKIQQKHSVHSRMNSFVYKCAIVRRFSLSLCLIYVNLFNAHYAQTKIARSHRIRAAHIPSLVALLWKRDILPLLCKYLYITFTHRVRSIQKCAMHTAQKEHCTGPRCNFPNDTKYNFFVEY